VEALCNTFEVALARRTEVSIDRVSSLDKVQIDKLRHAHITSVEGLVGQLEADPAAFRDLLNLDPPEVKKLTADARALLSPQTRREFARQSSKRYSYGALNPNRD
jgi:hypothetical protein